MEKTELKGGCFVLPTATDGGNTNGGGPLSQVIGTTTGAVHLSQYRLNVKGGQSPQNNDAGQSPHNSDTGRSPVYSFGKSDVLLFVISGNPRITISGKDFEAAPEAGLYVKPGEVFHVKGHAEMLVTACPEAAPAEQKEMPDNFDESFPERMVAPDASMREEMGDRYYQVLVGNGVGSGQVTQFIGEIPKLKAPSHHHLYEEALYVLSGEGFMWTGDEKAHVGPGSIIFLPKKQEHSLECTSNSGLRVVGHFTPAGSPAENY